MRSTVVFLLLSSLLFSSQNSLIGQNFCGTASDEPPGCFLSSNTYSGTTSGFSTSTIFQGITGSCPFGFNDSWLEFIPVCESVELRMPVGNCSPRNPTQGIGVAVLDENFVVPLNCVLFRIAGMQNQRYTISGLTPGKKYHLVITNSYQGQVCDYTLQITGANVFNPSGSGLFGEFEIQDGSTTKYYVEKYEEGSQYLWSTDAGVSIVEGQGSYAVLVNAPNQGQYQICCKITLPNGTVNDICEQISVEANFNKIKYEYGFYCDDSCYDFYGNCIKKSGVYNNQTTDAQGDIFSEYVELCLNDEPKIEIKGAPLITIPDTEKFATLEVDVVLGNGNYTYQWTKEENGESYPIPNSNFRILPVLFSGRYCVSIVDNDTGCNDFACIDVEVPVPLSDFCGVASDEPPGCLVCGSYYAGDTEGFTPNIVPSNFCGTIENNQWLSFIADSSHVSVEIRFWDCIGNGVQMYMLDLNLSPVSTCYTPNRRPPFSGVVAEHLIPGETYIIMLDGQSGSICQFEIFINGSQRKLFPELIEEIEAQSINPCQGQTICYDIADAPLAENFQWIVDSLGTIVSGQGTNQICVQWTGTGTGNLCVVPFNTCDAGGPKCLAVNIGRNASVNNLPKMEFCANDFPLDPATYCSSIDCPGVITEPGKYCIDIGGTGGTCDSTVCYTIEEIAVNVQIIDTFICSGFCIDWNGQSICSADTIQFVLPSANACNDILELRIREIDLNAVIELPDDYNCTATDSLLLVGTNSTFEPGINYNWISLDNGILEANLNVPTTFVRGVGRYVLESTFGSCYATDTVNVEGKLSPPVISCFEQAGAVTFSWLEVPSATEYFVRIDGVFQGAVVINSFTVSGLMPLQSTTIEVSAVGLYGCESEIISESCLSADCPTVDVQIDQVNAICFGQNLQPIQLNFTATGVGGGVVDWTGQGMNVDGMFNPNGLPAGTYPINLVYSENGCDYSAVTNIEILEQPTANFTVESPICFTDASEINYTGNSSITADYQWNFGGGVSNSATNSINQEVTWSAAGTYTVNLVVTENGCLSDMATQMVEVEEPIALPNLQCNATTSTVEITWDNIVGSTGFQVDLISGAAGTQTGNSYLVENLNPGDEITLSVTAQTDNNCGPTVQTITCEAKNCPPVQVAINPIPDLCFDSGLADINLNDFLSLSGNNSNAMITWSSNGTLINQNIFSTTGSGVGNYDVEVLVSDAGCDFSATASFKKNQNLKLILRQLQRSASMK